MNNELTIYQPSDESIVVYKSNDGIVQLEVQLANDTVWLTLDQMAELFQRNKSTISRHIKNIFECGELQRDMVVAKNATTTQHGALQGKTQTHDVTIYNLNMIISIGYKVNSIRGVQFRQWASRVLKEYLLRGYIKQQIGTSTKYGPFYCRIYKSMVKPSVLTSIALLATIYQTSKFADT